LLVNHDEIRWSRTARGAVISLPSFATVRIALGSDVRWRRRFDGTSTTLLEAFFLDELVWLAAATTIGYTQIRRLQYVG
jgi:hypothetical protein